MSQSGWAGGNPREDTIFGDDLGGIYFEVLVKVEDCGPCTVHPTISYYAAPRYSSTHAREARKLEEESSTIRWGLFIVRGTTLN